jgi:hypothetical protein
MTNDKKYVIFDLDGTLADIAKRRTAATKPNGKMDWDVFFDPAYINLDEPNQPVIDTAKSLKASGYDIVIFSGRSKGTKDATMKWLDQYGVPYSVLKMRPTSQDWKYMPDDQLKQHWLDDLFPVGSSSRDGLHMVFDDRNKVVDMWRANGIPCFQVAPGDF